MKSLNTGSIVMLLSLTFAISAQNVLACRCAFVEGESIETAAERSFYGSFAVFEAKVAGFEFKKGISASGFLPRDPALADPDKFMTKIVKFEFGRIWKGEATKLTFATDEYKTDSGLTIGSSCDFNFEVGQKYLVFATEKNGVLRTGACSGTRRLTGSSDDKAVLTHFGSFCIPDYPDAK